MDRGANGARAYLESLPGLRLVMGEATFEEPGVVVVDGERIRAPRVIVATGNTPAPPPIPGLDETPYLTSSDVLVRRELPERLVVIGAGPIGLELGQALSRLGARVTMVEVGARACSWPPTPRWATSSPRCCAGRASRSCWTPPSSGPRRAARACA